ncbi:hypothetical protein [Streptomyces litmocidini]|uniref:Uncharacterized protein n=1 Tax=Streptomyces litmocidini TaxID=67318 RepID=A0ABW7UND1_9ACTN
MSHKHALAAALALGAVTVVASQSTAAAGTSSARPGAGFRAISAGVRGSAIRIADREAEALAKSLGFGTDEKPAAKDVLVDTDGTRHGVIAIG